MVDAIEAVGDAAAKQQGGAPQFDFSTPIAYGASVERWLSQNSPFMFGADVANSLLNRPQSVPGAPSATSPYGDRANIGAMIDAQERPGRAGGAAHDFFTKREKSGGGGRRRSTGGAGGAERAAREAEQRELRSLQLFNQELAAIARANEEITRRHYEQSELNREQYYQQAIADNVAHHQAQLKALAKEEEIARKYTKNRKRGVIR